ncbi:hypothetical protein DVH05_020998 [Phytophthora capsici]|nr:hypothetical protein DVH05_020998 [Phytophthora capsici]
MDDGDDTTTLLLCIGKVIAQHERNLSDARDAVFELLVEEAWKVAMRSQHYLTRQCLDKPSESAWMSLYMYGDDLNFLNATSLTILLCYVAFILYEWGYRAAFTQLLVRFSYFYRIPPPSSRGRVNGEQHAVVVVRVVAGNTLSNTRRAEKALVASLRYYKPARIAWPSPARQVGLARLMEAREPHLKHIFGFIDGKNLRVKQPSNVDMQHAMYNGWLHSVLVTGTICFAADSCIIWSRHNCPGSWNDADTSLGFRKKLLDPRYCPDSRMNVVSDSVFPCPTIMTG